MVTCHAMATRPDGAGPAAIDAVAPKTSTATVSEPTNAKRRRKPLSKFMRRLPITGLQHSPSAQLLHFGLGHAETAEYLGVVMAQLRVGCVLDQTAVVHLRVAEHLLVIVDRAAGYAGRLEHGHPMIGGICGE